MPARLLSHQILTPPATADPNTLRYYYRDEPANVTAKQPHATKLSVLLLGKISALSDEMLVVSTQVV